MWAFSGSAIMRGGEHGNCYCPHSDSIPDVYSPYGLSFFNRNNITSLCRSLSEWSSLRGTWCLSAKEQSWQMPVVRVKHVTLREIHPNPVVKCSKTAFQQEWENRHNSFKFFVHSHIHPIITIFIKNSNVSENKTCLNREQHDFPIYDCFMIRFVLGNQEILAI